MIVLFALSALIAAIPVIVFVIIRESVKHKRQEIIKDLEIVFGPKNNQEQDVLPALEFVKYKYFIQRPGGTGPGARRDFLVLHWFVSMVPLVATMTLLNAFVIIVVCKELGVDVGAGLAWLSPVGLTVPTVPLPLYAVVIAASYTGALMFMMRSFFRAINNFDLSPLSFMGAWVNLVLGVTASWFFIFGLMKLPGSLLGGQIPPDAVLAATIVTSFAIGYLPDLAARNLIRASQLRNYKREDVEVYKSFTAIPVEVIDGVDTEIRDRLAEYHISAVQNLAAINPLLLYVETPYGVYQIMDWVAQAQLCCSVGPSSLVKLWRLGIRTIFDLERAAVDDSCRHSEVLAEIGVALFGADGKSPAIGIKSEAAIVADILTRLESPHVLRLRQLFIRVGDRMSGYRRFKPVMDCPPGPAKDCPFVAAARARAA